MSIETVTLSVDPGTGMPGAPGMPEPAGGSGTMILDRPDTAETDSGDHERFAHYVRKDKIVESAVMGGAVVALCGKVWVPNRDPGKFPVCPECKEIYEGLKAGGDSSSGSGSGTGGDGAGGSGADAG